MTCRELIEFLLAYMHSELPSGQRAAFEAHLSECDECRAYLASYEKAVRLGKSAFKDEEADADDQVPEGLIEAVLLARNQSD